MKIGAIPKRTQQFPYHRFARGELLVLGKVSHQFQRSRESQACGVVSFHKGHFFSDSPALLLTSVLLLIYSWNVLNVAHSFHQQVATSVSESFQEIIFGHSDPHHSEIKRKHLDDVGFGGLFSQAAILVDELGIAPSRFMAWAIKTTLRNTEIMVFNRQPYSGKPIISIIKKPSIRPYFWWG